MLEKSKICNSPTLANLFQNYIRQLNMKSIIIFDMDIKTGIVTAISLAVFGMLITFWSGFSLIRSTRKLMYYRLRQKRVSQGWRRILVSIGLAGIAMFLARFGEPAVYSVYKPSPTPSLSPTASLSPTTTLSPTITLTPTITDTPSITDTPTITSTPFIPEDIARQFASAVTPNPAVIFSPLVFAREIDLKTYQAIDEGTVFINPMRKIVALFSFDGMASGVQWTSLWYRDGKLIYYETGPWKDTTGGYGYIEYVAAPDEWLPGDYEVQIFVGNDWVTVGRFIVDGMPNTATATKQPTATRKPTATRVPTQTPTLTLTKQPTLTFTPSQTRRPTSTPQPSATRRPTDTAWPSATSTP